MLNLFSSKPQVISGQHQTSFSNEPTEITETNAEAFFRNDHTTNCFKDGHCKGDNFEYATAIPFDIDNSHSDNPDEWITPEQIADQLKERGINFTMTASRNHLLQKDDKAPRPKFHVYLPLSEPFNDSGTFVLLCEWCIKTFNADQKVKSKAQKMFGYGDNPNAFVRSWNEGQCVNIVLNEDDIARARLDGRLINIGSDVSKLINDVGKAKILISRDRISARHPYGELFDMKDNYARLMFAMNELPHQFFSDAALTKRMAIVPFIQQIRPEDIDTNFTERIISNELPGVLNWVIIGLDQLLQSG